MATLGFFDGGLRKEFLFSGTTVPEGWFDEILVPSEGAPSVPSDPQNLSASAGDSYVQLSWTATLGATSYKIYRSITPGFYVVELATGVIGTSYIDSTAINGTKYYYVIKATNGVGDSGYSNEVDATPQAPVAPISGAGNRTPIGHRVRIVHFEEELVVHSTSLRTELSITKEVYFASLLKGSLDSELGCKIIHERSIASQFVQEFYGRFDLMVAIDKSLDLDCGTSILFAMRGRLKTVNIESDKKLADLLLALEEETIP